jgi:AraC family transcriptional activator of mtrCDE
MIGGKLNASFGSSIDLFAGLAFPISEQFGPADHLGQQMRSALEEFVGQGVGTSAMTALLIKPVLVALLRRSLTSESVWASRFAVLSDPQIACAFAAMAARPNAGHSVSNLCKTAGLSRTAFMLRFSKVFGCGPIAVLRELRMYSAATMLSSTHLSIDQVAFRTGYASRSSFVRVFRRTYGSDPSEYRSGARTQRVPTAMMYQ